MAKLYFSYAAMNAGKSTNLLQVAHNYEERGMRVELFASALNTRDGEGKVASRVGIVKPAHVFGEDTDFYKTVTELPTADPIACILIDEANWLTKEQVNQLAHVVDELKIPVMCYGLRTDFQGELFPGSERLLALADELREIRTICHCGQKATMVLRHAEDGSVVTRGPQNQVGGNETYTSVCRMHWREAFNK